MLHAKTDIEQTAINVSSLQAFFFVAVSDENAYCKTKALSQPERDLAHAAWLWFVSFIVQ